MAAAAQPNIGIKQGWASLEDGWGDDMNANLRALDLLAQPVVLDKDSAAPPLTPAVGDAYIVAAGAVGAWTSHATHIARWQAPVAPDADPVAGWEFFTPKAGWEVWVADEAKRYRFAASVWALTVPNAHAHTIAEVTGLQTALDDLTATDVLKASKTVAINGQTGTTYSLVVADAGKVIRQSNAAAITTTVPANATQPFAVGDTVSIRQVAAGAVTLTGAGGVTINTPAASLAKTGRQGATIMLHKVATDEWDLTGDLAAA
jgi:hypothetical protein